MAKFVLSYLKQIGAYAARYKEESFAANDHPSAIEKARRMWSQIRQKARQGIVPFKVTVKSPALRNDNGPIDMTFDTS